MQSIPRKRTSFEASINISNTFDKLLLEKDIAMATMDFLDTDDEESSNSCESKIHDIHIRKINTFVFLVSCRTNDSSL